jgi:hypothetical protein
MYSVSLQSWYSTQWSMNLNKQIYETRGSLLCFDNWTSKKVTSEIFMSNVVTILHYFNNIINLKEMKYVCRVIIFFISIYWYEIKDSFFCTGKKYICYILKIYQMGL